MNSSIEQLARTASKRRKLIIGLMSGTSLDGLDIALCRLTGCGRETELELLRFTTVAYPQKIAAALREVVSAERPALEDVCLLHTWLADYHADLVIESLQEWEIDPAGVDCIASHGQTVYHAPKTLHGRQHMPNATLQLGDGDHIARRTGILTISDFRQKHTAAGGEGAPMAALTDELLYRDAGQARLLLNIGGIANFTYLPLAGGGTPVTTDTGPGNTLIDRAVQARFGQPCDRHGAIAGRGTVRATLLKVLTDDPFFSLSLPRTTGPEYFNMTWLKERMQQAGAGEPADEDLVATLTWLTAQTIADAIHAVADKDQPEVYLSGGGMHNRQLVEWLEQLLGRPTHSFAEIGFDPDAKEAACFAVLANETLSGRAFTVNPKQSTGRNVNFGKISLPV